MKPIIRGNNAATRRVTKVRVHECNYDARIDPLEISKEEKYFA